jgi:integrase/recombinase XerC
MSPFFCAQEFRNYLRSEKRYSAHTITAYLNDVDEFSAFLLRDKNTADLKDAVSKDVRLWMMDLLDSGISARSVARKLSSLRGYFGFLLKFNHVSSNPVHRIKSPASGKRLPKVFSKEDVESVLDNGIVPDTPEGLRDKLIIELFYATGIRLSELIGLRVMDFRSNELLIHGKRNKERIVPLHQRIIHLLNEYMVIRKSFGPLSAEDSLIVLDSGKKMYPKFVFNKINSYFGNVSTTLSRSPHMLRHSFATHMLNSGADLNGIKELLGHSSLQATQVYTHYSFDRLKSIHKQTHPRGDKKRR